MLSCTVGLAAPGFGVREWEVGLAVTSFGVREWEVERVVSTQLPMVTPAIRIVVMTIKRRRSIAFFM
jgi:hypothetical protein